MQSPQSESTPRRLTLVTTHNGNQIIYDVTDRNSNRDSEKTEILQDLFEISWESNKIKITNANYKCKLVDFSSLHMWMNSNIKHSSCDQKSLSK